MVKRKPKGVEPQSDSNDEWPPAWYREYLVKALQDGDAQYERLVTTLTAAALGGSFALVRVQTATDPHYGIWGYFLVFSWFAWLISLWAGIYSIRVSQRDLRQSYDEMYARRPAAVEADTVRKNEPDLTALVHRLNDWSFYLLVVGVISFGVFVIAYYVYPRL